MRAVGGLHHLYSKQSNAKCRLSRCRGGHHATETREVSAHDGFNKPLGKAKRVTVLGDLRLPFNDQ